MEKLIFTLNLLVMGKKLLKIDFMYGNVKRLSFIGSETMGLGFLFYNMF